VALQKQQRGVEHTQVFAEDAFGTSAEGIDLQSSSGRFPVVPSEEVPMPAAILEEHDRPPSALSYMARAFLPRPRARDATFPPLVERWRGFRVDRDALLAFGAATGLDAERDEVSVLFPHVAGFRLQMSLLTHRAFPLPIWRTLQIRKRMVRHASFAPGDVLDLETKIGAGRVVEKGLEVDLESRLVRGSTCVWESSTTYFHRGRFGVAGEASAHAASPDLDDASEIARFRMGDGRAWDFGALTGDYNGIHRWRWYARRMGFSAAFAHPQRSAGLCMSRLPRPSGEAQTLELWLKGPVFYGAEVVLRANVSEHGVTFAASVDGEARPALIGRWGASGPSRG
jgi:hypothetical protein